MEYTKDFHNRDLLVDPITGIQVMMEWEKPYMEALIERLNPKGKVLEIGFGMGYSANAIQEYPILSHTIIEQDPEVLKRLYEWAKKQPHKVEVIEGLWQEKLNLLGTFDTIFFDDSQLSQLPDPGQLRVYDFYYRVLSQHVNQGCRMSWYCDYPIFWVCHPSTEWSITEMEIEVPSNVNYVPQVGDVKVYLPLLTFRDGIVEGTSFPKPVIAKDWTVGYLQVNYLENLDR